ncbi:MAG: HEAT repeat domain-containing protein [Planctomycetaceae bacterium]
MARTSRALLVFAAVAGFASALQADVIKLKNGGEIRGTIPRKAGTLLDETVTIETLGGGVVTLERKEIQFITWRSPAVEEFESKVREVPRDDLDALRELVEWCREKGLTEQRMTVLERIIELEPDDPDARAALGHSRYDGQWMSRDERMEAQGYVKHRGKYLTRQELDLILKTEAQRKAEQEWFPKVRSWQSWADGRNAARQEEGLAQLGAIDDPAALPALDRFLSNHADRGMRVLYVSILDRLPGEAAVPALVEKSLHDADQEIRWRALNALDREQHAAARPIYVRGLKSDMNVVVRRSARALERVGDRSSIPDLIAALVTSHRYRVEVPANDAVSFNTNGTFSLGGSPGVAGLSPELQSMLLSGQFPNGVIVMPNQPAPQVRTRVVTVRVNQQNPETLTALQKLTGENHGYDARTWQLWWAAHKAQLDGPTVQ